MHPYRLTPSTRSPQHPSRLQHTSRSIHNHRPRPRETYNYSDPVPTPVPATNNTMRMRHANYPNRTVQETYHHRISINSTPRGSHVVPVRFPPPPVQTRSVTQHPPHETHPPVLTPQPVPFLPPPLENLEAMVSVPAFNQHEQNKKEGEAVEIEQVPVNDNKAEIMHSYTALGQSIYLILSSLKDQTEKVESSHKAENELRAMNEALYRKNKELEQEVVDIRNEKEEAVKKAEDDVQQAKSGEASWRKECMELNEQQMAFKKKSEENDNNIRVLIEKAAENKSKLAQERAKVLSLEMSERKLKIQINELKEKVRNLESSEQKLKEDRNQLTKLEEDFNKMTEKNKKLNNKISHFVKNEKANKKAMQELETNIKLQVKELEKTILQKTNEFSLISQELEEKKNDNKLKVNELKEKSKIIRDLNDDLKSTQKKNDDLLYKFEIILNAVKSPVLPKDPKKQHEQTASCSSPSSENETFPGSSSSSITKDGYNENVGNSRRSEVELLELEDSSKFSLNNTLGKRKYAPSIKRSAAKKQREDDHNGRQNKLISFPEISHIHSNQESNTEEGGTEIPEMSITSRSTRSSTGRRQRKHE